MEKLRVLVVEDDVLVGQLLAEMLTAMGHRVEAVVTTQDEAVRAADHHRPDIIVVDENLRIGSGSAAMTQILSRGFVPHVFMTGGSPHARLTSAAFLAKPFFENDLRRAMQAALMANASV
jgi:CheY-like chemotaxis protein